MPVRIRHTDPTQETDTLQRVAEDVSKILTENEELLYIALQNKTALSMKKDSVVATSNRLIYYRPGMLGRVSFDDFAWQNVKDVKIDQGMLSTIFVVVTVDGKTERLGGLDKDQAKRAYAIAQQLEQEWREKRRVREMEEARARAGGVVMSHAPAAPAIAAEDPVAKLAKAKQMLDQKLISEAEYDALKARILGAM